MVRAKLTARFESAEELQSEFDQNIVNGGLFVPCEGSFDPRQAVVVEVQFPFSNCSPTSFELNGEVVHQVPVEMAANGATPGAAVQFEASAQELRDLFLPMLDPKRAAAPPDADLDNEQRRSSRRNPVRVPVRVMPLSSAPFEVTSRDLSASGILLSLRGQELPVGETLCVCLWHPNGESSIEIDGQVMREVRNKKGRIAAVAVAFDRRQASDPQVSKIITALRRAGQQSRLGGISGSIGDLGVGSLVQMFGSSSPRGTLVVERDGEQGYVAFADELFLDAELGPVSGIEALVTMLDWGEGRFEFEATIAESLLESEHRMPLTGALLEATRIMDERDDADSNEDSSDDIVFDLVDNDLTDGGVSEEGDTDLNAQTTVMDNSFLGIEPAPAAHPVDWRGDMTFLVNTDREAAVRSGLGKVEEAVLDLASAGMSIQKFGDIIPESPQRIQEALEILVDLSVLRPR